jgi:2-polyprenyl-3-methyl-5-hydroxy-6-metoxy-1,4-benzoquinol methylase
MLRSMSLRGERVERLGEERRSLRERAYDDYFSTVFATLHTLDDVEYARAVPRVRKLYLPFLPDDRSRLVLDCGAGVGALVHALKELGYNAKGIDISPAQVALARKRGIDVIEGEATSYLRSHPESCGAVIAADMLEHLTKDEALEFLDAVQGALVPGGRVVVRTANANSPFATRLRYKDVTHETAYTEETLASLFHLAGLRTVAVIGGHDVPGLRGYVKRLVASPFRLWWRGFMIAELGPREGRMGPLDLTIVGVAERAL